MSDTVIEEHEVANTDMIPAWMSAREFVELQAMVETYEALPRPSFIHAKLHRKFFMRLRNHGFVLWKWPHPTMSRSFAQIEPTPEAIKLIRLFK